jgi:hypothetical protein
MTARAQASKCLISAQSAAKLVGMFSPHHTGHLMRIKIYQTFFRVWSLGKVQRLLAVSLWV